MISSIPVLSRPSAIGMAPLFSPACDQPFSACRPYAHHQTSKSVKLPSSNLAISYPTVRDLTRILVPAVIFRKDIAGVALHNGPHTSWSCHVESQRKSTGSCRCEAAATTVVAPLDTTSGFADMAVGSSRKYFMIGGKGGVGKTSVAASLAVKFANSGHPTLVVSTDPAHSLSDSFAQDLTGGIPVEVEGTDLPLFAMEINPEQSREEFRAATSSEEGGGEGGLKEFMDGVGLGSFSDQLSELKLGELLDTPPPGLDEAVAIAKVVQFTQAEEYDKFTRIIFDTAPTGHTLRLLSLPDFLEASIGKILRLKQKLTSASDAIKSVFGQRKDGGDKAGDKLELLKQRMIVVRNIFRDKEATEFVIVTIPTVMAISESSRLLSSLAKEGVPVKRVICNQVLPPSTQDCKFCAIKRKDQGRALDMLRHDPGLSQLQVIESPLFDMEIRGVPALKFMGDRVWGTDS